MLCFTYSMRIENLIKTFALTTALAIAPITANKIYAGDVVSQKESRDTFERSVTPQGTTDYKILSNAPKPNIIVAGKQKVAGIVVDLESNILYRYDSNGTPIKAYQVASGKESSPTQKGVRIVTHTEKYPYSKAPRRSYRRRHPRDFGAYILCLNKLNPETGEQSSTGQFIHGCRNYDKTFNSDPHRRVSHGCIRMEESAITGLALGGSNNELEKALKVKSGEIVIIK